MCIIFVRSISKDCSAIYILVFSLLETTNKDNYTSVKCNKQEGKRQSGTLTSSEQVHSLVSGKLVESNQSFKMFGKLFKVFLPNETDTPPVNFKALSEITASHSNKEKQYYSCVAYIKRTKKETSEWDLLEMLNELRTTLKKKEKCHIVDFF